MRHQTTSIRTVRLASAQGRFHELEQILRFWDRADDLEANASGLGTQLKGLQDELDMRGTVLSDRRKEIFTELDEEFAENVAIVATTGARRLLPLESLYRTPGQGSI